MWRFVSACHSVCSPSVIKLWSGSLHQVVVVLSLHPLNALPEAIRDTTVFVTGLLPRPFWNLPQHQPSPGQMGGEREKNMNNRNHNKQLFIEHLQCARSGLNVSYTSF